MRFMRLNSLVSKRQLEKYWIQVCENFPTLLEFYCFSFLLFSESPLAIVSGFRKQKANFLSKYCLYHYVHSGKKILSEKCTKKDRLNCSKNIIRINDCIVYIYQGLLNNDVFSPAQPKVTSGLYLDVSGLDGWHKSYINDLLCTMYCSVTEASWFSFYELIFIILFLK